MSNQNSTVGYNPDFLEKTNIFTETEKRLLEELNGKPVFDKFMTNKNFVDNFGLDFIHTSAKIEGNTYDKLDTLTLIDYGRTAGGKRYSDAKMILNLREAYDILIKDNLPINKTTLKYLHHILSNEMVASHERGTPREGSIVIGASNYVPLSSINKLDAEVNYIFKKYKEIDNAFDKAVYLHNNLCYLQYFKDCNKRTARTMLNLSLKNDEKMLYIPHEERVKDYLEGVITYYEKGDYSVFKEYFISECRDVSKKMNFQESEKEQKNLARSRR